MFQQTCVAFLVLSTVANATDFTLNEHLGHNWSNERVSFPLTPQQLQKAESGLALVDSEGKEVAYQLEAKVGQDQDVIWLQADLPRFKKREFSFADRQAKAKSDLKIVDTDNRITVENNFIGLAIRKSLNKGEGPIAGVRLRAGRWTGDSLSAGMTAVGRYSAKVSARGPVFVEVLVQTEFSDGGQWRLRFRIERGEPVIVVDESFDAPGGGTFRVTLGSKDYQPTHLLYRGGSGGSLGNLNEYALAPGRAFNLQPWLQWWGAERQGNWFSLYTAPPKKQLRVLDPLDKKKPSLADDLLGDDSKKPKTADPHPDMLMVGVLRPSLWRNPNWSGNARQVGVNVAADYQDGRVTITLPLGGGRRRWMISTPDKAKSLEPLASKNRRVAPLPQQYAIKHGDFPLDEIKDYVLQWPGDHDNYPRLLIGKQDLPKLRETLKPNPREVRRWESEQPIDKYNIEGPLREYFASNSPRLGIRIVDRTEEWLHSVVHDDILLQNSRVTLGVAPHSQAVLLLPAINLTDAALGVESLTTEQRQRFLAQLALLGYAVNRDDYWSPARGFSANPNMSTVVAQYQVAVACLIPSHPMAKQWAEKGLATLRRQLYEWSDEDGGWLEAPHYAMVSFDHMLGGFIMAARAGFANYLYENRVRKVAEWFAKTSTPPDVHTGGFRHLPPIGNTYHGEGTGMFGIVAGLWKERDPEFAAHMQWMCEQHGSPDLGLGWSFPAMTGYKLLLKSHGVQPRKPSYGSAWFRRTGVVLRNQIGTDRETYLHLIAGSHHEHYDDDSGSFVIWGKGRVLADDWGYIGRHARQFHSLLSSPTAGGNMQIDEFSTQPTFDYVSGKRGTWQRQIGFVKDTDPLGPNFFLIRDTHNADTPAEWRLWLTTRPDAAAKDAPAFPTANRPSDGAADLLDDIKKAGNGNKQTSSGPSGPPVKIHSQGATVHGEGDVDFDLFFYKPEQFNLSTKSVWQNTTVANRDGKIGPTQLKQTALIASLKGRGSLAVLVYPRLKTEPSPKVTWHAAGRIAQVVSKAGTDFVFLNEGGPNVRTSSLPAVRVNFTGNAGAIQLRKRRATLTLGSAGEVHFADDKLTKKGSVSHSSPLR